MVNTREIKQHALYRFARVAPTNDLRVAALRRIPFVEYVGTGVAIGPTLTLTPFTDQGNDELLYIDDNARIAPDVSILCSSETENTPLADTYGKKGPIEIGSGSWIGANCVLLPGVTIGERAVVGAGSVVIEDVEPETVVGGIPAKHIKDVE